MEPTLCDPAPASAQASLRGNDPRFYEEILYNISDGVYFVDRERRILYWNGGARNLTGYETAEMVGRLCYDNILAHVDGCGTALCEKMCPLSAAMADGQSHSASVFLRHKQGHRLPVSVRVQPIRGRDGRVEGAVEIFSSNTAQVETERRVDEMKRMAFIDHLTGLPNRRYLEMMLRSSHREFAAEGVAFGLMLIDVDRFKEINDKFGHRCGDSVLLEIGKTLVSCIRSSDVLGRWGGDEFVGIIRGVDQAELKAIAERSVNLVGRSDVLDKDQRRVQVSVSVGAALIQDFESAEELFSRVDDLMYASKASGRGRVTFSAADR